MKIPDTMHEIKSAKINGIILLFLAFMSERNMTYRIENDDEMTIGITRLAQPLARNTSINRRSREILTVSIRPSPIRLYSISGVKSNVYAI